MGFRLKRVSFGRCLELAVVLLWGTFASAGSGNNPTEIEVLVYDSVRIPQSVLDRAEFEAARILRTAGVEVTWANCSSRYVFSYVNDVNVNAVNVDAVNTNDDCHRIPGFNQFVLHIVPTGRTSSDLVFGLSFLDENGSGKYSDVFFDRIDDARRDFGLNLSRLLGTVAAHELGHLLLGSRAHSSIGIMTPQWGKDTLRRMNMGNLLFTREQASRIQARIRHDDVRLATFSGRAAVALP